MQVIHCVTHYTVVGFWQCCHLHVPKNFRINIEKQRINTLISLFSTWHRFVHSLCVYFMLSTRQRQLERETACYYTHTHTASMFLKFASNFSLSSTWHRFTLSLCVSFMLSTRQRQLESETACYYTHTHSKHVSQVCSQIPNLSSCR